MSKATRAICVGTADRFPSRRPRRVRVANTSLVVLDGKSGVSGPWYAYSSVCPHRGAPLDDALVIGSILVCPWHGSEFDLRAGNYIQGPSTCPLRVFKVSKRRKRIFVNLEHDGDPD